MKQLSILAVLLLSACGGSNDRPPPPPVQAPVPPPVATDAFTVQVAQLAAAQPDDTEPAALDATAPSMPEDTEPGPVGP